MSGAACITGMGAVTPAGWSVGEMWDAVVDGRSAIARFSRFPLFHAATKVGGVVPGMEQQPAEDETLSLRFGLVAARDALRDAGIEEGSLDLAIVGNHGEWRAPRQHSQSLLLMGAKEIANRIAAAVGAPESLAIYGTCAAGTLAIGTALQLIRAGRVQVVLAGGADCLLREVGFFQFCTFYTMTTRDCPPEEASCPFDNRRDGFVPAEGAGFVVLESSEHALRRGAIPYAFVKGFGSTQSAYHLVASPPDALGPSLCMQSALRDAKLQPADIDYVNAHGTSTRDNDWCETLAIHRVFGHDANRIPVSASKSVLGHMMGAAGAVEVIICVKSLQNGVIPPTINQTDPDPRCDLDYVPWTARKTELRHVIKNSFGFGGYNASLVLGVPE